MGNVNDLSTPDKERVRARIGRPILISSHERLEHKELSSHSCRHAVRFPVERDSIVRATSLSQCTASVCLASRNPGQGLTPSWSSKEDHRLQNGRAPAAVTSMLMCECHSQCERAKLRRQSVPSEILLC